MNAFCVEIADKQGPIKEENKCKVKATSVLMCSNQGHQAPLLAWRLVSSDEEEEWIARVSLSLHVSSNTSQGRVPLSPLCLPHLSAGLLLKQGTHSCSLLTPALYSQPPQRRMFLDLPLADIWLPLSDGLLLISCSHSRARVEQVFSMFYCAETALLPSFLEILWISCIRWFHPQVQLPTDPHCCSPRGPAHDWATEQQLIHQPLPFTPWNF